MGLILWSICTDGHLEKLSKATSGMSAKVFLLGKGVTIHGLRQEQPYSLSPHPVEVFRGPLMSIYDISTTEFEVDGAHVGIVAARFNAAIVTALIDGATRVLNRYGIGEDKIELIRVPGAYELPFAANRLMQSTPVEAVIALGAVIRGQTPHFDFIAGGCSHGLMDAGLRHNLPIAFGVLTTNTFAQACERAGGAHGNKGEEAALAAIEMITLSRQLRV